MMSEHKSGGADSEHLAKIFRVIVVLLVVVVVVLGSCLVFDSSTQREMRGSITFKIVPSYRSQSMSCEVWDQTRANVNIFVFFEVLFSNPSVRASSRGTFILLLLAERVPGFVPTVPCKRPC